MRLSVHNCIGYALLESVLSMTSDNVVDIGNGSVIKARARANGLGQTDPFRKRKQVVNSKPAEELAVKLASGVRPWVLVLDVPVLLHAQSKSPLLP